jgi:alkylhydroperoxidase/carboxymuconolactone decarboxylase family protein YurZ
MSEDTILTTKQKELIALGASIAAGCQPYTIHYLQGARAVGASERGVTMAITAGADVRRAATEGMAAWGIDQLGSTTELPDQWLSQRRLTRALVFVAAAFAANSVPEFLRLADEAHRLGATDRHMQVAVAIARKVKRAATEKIESAASQFDPNPTSQPGCACTA